MGTHVSAELGYSSSAFGDANDSLIYRLGAGTGVGDPEHAMWLLDAGIRPSPMLAAAAIAEVNIETDFSARNENFVAFVDKVITKDDLRITPAPVNRGTIAALYLASLDA